MAIELASTHAVRKPWGRTDLLPWNRAQESGEPIGEVWFERARPDHAGETSPPTLLLKLLYTSQPLSIQVHPDDAFAHTLGQPRGKSEAWVVLKADPGSKVAVGLKQRVATPLLRAAIRSGSITEMVAWQTVREGDVISVPAGTIHAIGAGLVLAEIQQRSDTTFRLFDFGRGRELHVDYAIAAATPGPAIAQISPRPMTDERTLLIATPYFVLERIRLGANAGRDFKTATEAWLLVLEGTVRLGPVDAIVGEAIFVAADGAPLKAGPAGFTGLLAHGADRWQADTLTPNPDHMATRIDPAPEGALQ